MCLAASVIMVAAQLCTAVGQIDRIALRITDLGQPARAIKGIRALIHGLEHKGGGNPLRASERAPGAGECAVRSVAIICKAKTCTAVTIEDDGVELASNCPGKDQPHVVAVSPAIAQCASVEAGSLSVVTALKAQWPAKRGNQNILRREVIIACTGVDKSACPTLIVGRTTERI